MAASHLRTGRRNQSDPVPDENHGGRGDYSGPPLHRRKCLMGASGDAHADGMTVRDTNAELSTAVSARVSEGLFIGSELRYLASFDKFSLSKVTDTGVFVGPTVFAKLSERASLSAAWSTRIGGKIRSEPDPVPDFGNVPDPTERHH